MNNLIRVCLAFGTIIFLVPAIERDVIPLWLGVLLGLGAVTAAGLLVYLEAAKRTHQEDAPRGPASIPQAVAHRLETDNGSFVLDPGKEPCPMSDERFTTLPFAATASASGAEWHVIHGGKELGPLTLAEVVGKAAIGEIDADDLVKQTGGLWTKARDFAFLQQQFLLRKSGGKASQVAPAQANQNIMGTVSPAALVMFIIGAVLFLLGHVDIAFGKPPAGPLLFLITCCIWGLFFGVPAYLCFHYKRRTGLETVALLFLIAAGLDVAYQVYRTMLLVSGANGPLINVQNQPQVEKKVQQRLEDQLARQHSASAFIERGRAWLAKFKCDNAIQDFDEAIRLDPNNTLAFSNRGIAWLGKHEYDNAI